MMEEEEHRKKHHHHKHMISEEKLMELKKEIEEINGQLSLLRSEDRSTLEERNQKIKLDKVKVTELQKQLNDMRIHLMKGTLGDEKILKKAFQKYPFEMKVMRNKTVEQTIEILEGRVFDLVKRRDRVRYGLHKKRDALAAMRDDLKDLEHKLHADEETDHEIVERAREVESEFQNLQMRILEMEEIERIYEEIQHKLKDDIRLLPFYVRDLETQIHSQRMQMGKLEARGRKGYEMKEIAKELLSKGETDAQIARQEKDKAMMEFNKVMEEKQEHPLELDLENRRMSAFAPVKLQAEEDLNNMKQQQEEKLSFYRESFDRIKDAMSVSNVDDAEKRFDSQRVVSVNLKYLKSQSEKMLSDIKGQGRRLREKRDMFMAASMVTSQKYLTEQRIKWEEDREAHIHKKQAFDKEHLCFTNILANTKVSLWYLLQLTENHLPEKKREPKSEPTISTQEIFEKLKVSIQMLDNLLKDKDMDQLFKTMSEDKPFMAKLRQIMGKRIPIRVKPKVAEAAAVPAETQKEEHSSSDEEEDRTKRERMKEEAHNVSEIKLKHKGRVMF